ncbi:T9SS type A sorting domain-containing protein [candidate division KSB1 bacterium]|nr:T9SS type A sorting domain-containing protein [candidate division KSB1 bacterium]
MKIKNYGYIFWVVVFGLISVVQTGFCQKYRQGNTIITQYGTSGNLNAKPGGNYKSTSLTLGVPFVKDASSTKYNTTLGMWSFYNREPVALTFNASEGDYSDHVQLRWQYDPLEPPVNGTLKIFRDGDKMANPLAVDTLYMDTQVMPGYYYNYELQAKNKYGLGAKAAEVGFVNPNGVITGRITTPHGNPVNGIELSLSPTTGKSVMLNQDSNNQFIQIPFDSSLILTQLATWECWIKPITTDDQMFISHYDNNIQDGYYINYHDNRLCFNQSNYGNLNKTSSKAGILKANEWQHLAIVKDSSQLTIFYNGKDVTELKENHADIISATTDIIWGIKYDGSDVFKGNLDELRFWNTAWDSATIALNMNRVVDDDSKYLISCWRLDEGMGMKIFDLTARNNDGKLIEGPNWNSDHANLHVSAFSNMKGIYNIKSIYYGGDTGKIFTVTPHKPGHLSWEPESRQVTLNSSATSADEVNFTDNSMIPVSGFIKYQKTECYVADVEIKEITPKGDTLSLVPPIFTDESGHFTVDFEPGSSHRLLFCYKDHTFSPSFFDVNNIIEPIAAGIILDTKLRDLTVTVAGGVCECPIGNAKVSIKTTNGCFNTTVTTNGNRPLTIRNLPAAKFEVIVNELPDPQMLKDISDGVQVSLIDSNNAVKFLHIERVQAETHWPANTVRCAEKGSGPYRVVQKDDTIAVKINVFREYKDPKTNRFNRCYLDSGSIEIVDQIADKEQKTVLYISCPDTLTPNQSTMPSYKLVPGLPNIVDGGEHPFQKNMTISAKDTANQESEPITEWAYVLGHKPRGHFFTTSMPELPLHILHDPPGDESYVEFSEHNVATTTWSFDADLKAGAKFNTKVMTGIDFEAGLGVSTETQATLTTNTSWSVDFSAEHGQSWTTSLKTSESFKTSSSGEIVGEEGDIFIGGALNIKYGITDVVKWDDTACRIKKDTTLAIYPTNFSTFFIYTENHIQDVIIPQLRYDIKDTTSAQAWEDILEMNAKNREHAEFIRNISFNSGAEYTNVEEITKNHSFKINTKIAIDRSVALAFEGKVGGSGSGFSVETKFGITIGGGVSHSSSQTTATKYVLSDNDLGDYFTVNVKSDSLYGTPVFELVAGASSCPWEPHTASREGVQLTMNTYAATNVDPETHAVFKLFPANISQTHEPMTYILRAIPESNPYGAVLRIDGQPLANAMIPVDLDSNKTKEMTLLVERGPYTNRYDSLKLMLCSRCAYQHWLDTGHPIPGDSVALSDTVVFSVHFEELCESNINISYPKAGWGVNQDDHDLLQFTIDGYDRNDPNFVRVLFEYARDQGNVAGAEWIIADTISVDTLKAVPNNYMTWKWDVSDLYDGPYWIRVKSQCGDGYFTYSEPLPGYIDRNQPQIYGTPEPADGALGPNDLIKVSFMKIIECADIFPDQVTLFDETQNKAVPIKWPISCDEQSITIVPDVQNYFIENHQLRASISSVRNKDGNILRKPITWEFFVDRSPIHWNQPEIEILQNEGQKQQFLATLRNTGSNSAKFSFSGDPFWKSVPEGATPLPWWLLVTPSEGELLPGSEIQLSFGISEMLQHDLHQDTIYVHSSFGDEPFIIKIRTLCEPPVWDFDSRQYQYSMSVNAQIALQDSISSDLYDRIGAFVNNECRGWANLTYLPEFNRYQAFLSIHSNQQSGEQVQFRIWDASDCEEYWEIDQQITYENGGIIGSPTIPVVFKATGAVAQFSQLYGGWTWFSVHLSNNSSNMNINNAIAKFHQFKAGDRIIHQNEFESWSQTQEKWCPGTLVLNPRTMYKAYMDSLRSPIFVGHEIDPDSLSITLQPNWNWIGYPMRLNQTVKDALHYLIPTDGSIIKDETTFSEYVAEIGIWFGSLQWLEPGHGYMFKSTANEPLSFHYAKGQAVDSGGLLKESNKNSSTIYDARRFESNMNLILKIDDIALNNEALVIKAIVEDECCGTAQPLYIPEIEEYRIFLTVQHHRDSREMIHLKIIKLEADVTYDVQELISFKTDDIVGDVLHPFHLTKQEPAQIPDKFSLSQNYPNPFNPSTAFTFGLPRASEVQIVVYDLLGRQVKTLIQNKCDAGYHKVRWNGSNQQDNAVASGMYIVRMKTGDFEYIRKILLLK